MPRKVTRREFIGGAVATTALAGAAHAAAAAAATRPNVLFILADDLGYGDLSCYGRPDYKTPVLDYAFAKQGLKFTDNYAAAPVCTPTRCAYITGRYPQRLPVGLEEPLKATSPEDAGLPPNHPTVASLLKGNGYETALVGKWGCRFGLRVESGSTQNRRGRVLVRSPGRSRREADRRRRDAATFDRSNSSTRLERADAAGAEVIMKPVVAIAVVALVATSPSPRSRPSPPR